MTLTMLQSFSDYFYDPFVFWGVPLALALLWAGLRGVHGWLRRRRSQAPLQVPRAF